MPDPRPLGVVRADWERWRASPVTDYVDFVQLRDRLIHDIGALLDENERLRHIVETDPFEELWNKADDEAAQLRAQRQAVLDLCDEVIGQYPGMGRGDVAMRIRAALGVSGTREDDGGN